MGDSASSTSKNLVAQLLTLRPSRRTSKSSTLKVFVSLLHNIADSCAQDTRTRILGAEYVECELSCVAEWEYQLRPTRPELMDSMKFVADSMDAVQDHIVGRIERLYWRAAQEEDAPQEQDGGRAAPAAAQGHSPDPDDAAADSAGAADENVGDTPGRARTPPLADTPGRAQKRRCAAEALDAQAKKMKKTAIRRQGRESGETELPFGCVVHIRVEDVDRAKLDNPNATVVVVDKTDKDNYKVACKAGVYKELVSRAYLNPVPNATAALVGLEDVLLKWKSMPTIGIRAVAASSSAAGGQGMAHCNCKGNCKGGKCSCLLAGMKCNSRCHKGNNKCKNHD